MWEDKLYGLYGNFNDDRNDDFKMPNGSLAMTETAFGNSGSLTGHLWFAIWHPNLQTVQMTSGERQSLYSYVM